LTPGGTAARDLHARRVFFYFAPLTLLVYLVEPSSQMVDFATSYMMKNQLHATAPQVARFRLLTAVPIYLAFVFGLSRDLWNPFGLRDRGFFRLFAALTGALLLAIAVTPLTYPILAIGMFLVMVSFSFVTSAYQGLLALVGQEQLMSGRLSVVWNIFSFVPFILGAVLAGAVASHVAPRETFIGVATLTLLIAAFSWWKPDAVFGHAYDRPEARGSRLMGDLRRLVRHRAAYPAVIVMLMFQFSPGSNTVLQYYLTNELGASDATYGYWWGIFLGSFLPVFLLYGYLCTRVRFSRLLWWGIAICIPQMLPLALIHSASAALWAAIPCGMMGGVAIAAIYDLAMRSCPPGLHGTLMMLVAGVFALATRAGDLLGTWIYDLDPKQGFLRCALATTAMYAAILPVLLLVPRELLGTADGERRPPTGTDLAAEGAAA
jgi:Major Facilitator Superfamily